MICHRIEVSKKKRIRPPAENSIPILTSSTIRSTLNASF